MSNIKGNSKLIDCYQIIEPLGRGANGTVYKGLNTQTGSFVAMKEMHLGRAEMKIISSEINFLKQLNHPNIVKYFDAIQKDSKIYLILEYIEEGSLSEFVKRSPFSQNLVKIYIKQTLLGIKYLHQMGVIHRDIKGANILLTKQGKVKLADFGVAVKVNEVQKTLSSAGTPYWIAPEIISGDSQVSIKCDIWSLGCTIIELLTGNPPYHDLLQFPALFRIVQDQYPPIPQNISESCKKFLLRCFAKDPRNRPDSSQLLTDQWLFDANLEQLSRNSPSLNIQQLNILMEANQLNYYDLTKFVTKSVNRKRIYSHRNIINIANSPQNSAKLNFIMKLIQDDFQAVKYLSQIGLFEKFFPQTLSAINKHLDLNIIALILNQICRLSCQNCDLCIFIHQCLVPMKQILIYATNARDKQLLQLIVNGLSDVMSQSVINQQHLFIILQEEGTGIISYLIQSFATMFDIKQYQISTLILHKLSKAVEKVNPRLFFSIQNQVKSLIRIDQTSIHPDTCFYNMRILQLISNSQQIAQTIQISGGIYYSALFLNKIVIQKQSISALDCQKLMGQFLKYIQNFVLPDTNRKIQFQRHQGVYYLQNLSPEVYKKQIKGQIDFILELFQ